MITLLCAVAGYLLGSVSFGIVASRLFGLPDPRSYGSGNPGATNVLRSGKRAAALVTLVGDIAKGMIVVAIARYVSTQAGAGDAPIAAAGLGAFMGHLYPLYFRFRGGKGVATALGVLLGFDAALALLSLTTFLIVAVVSRYASAASVAAAAVAIAAAPLFFGWGVMSGVVMLVGALVVWRHRGNLQRLLAGTERRLSFGNRDAPPAGGAS